MLPRGLLKEYARILSLLLRLADVVAVMMAAWVAHRMWFGKWVFPTHYLIAISLAAGLTFLVFPFFELYESVRVIRFWQYAFRLVEAVTTVFVLLAGLAFLTKTGEQFSRAWFLLAGIFFVLLLVCYRCGILLVLRVMRSRGWNERRVVIIGAGPLGEKLAAQLLQKLWTGFRIHAFFDDAPTNIKFLQGCLSVQQTPEDLGEFLLLQEGQIDEIWLALPQHEEQRIRALLYQVRHHTVAVRLALDVFRFARPGSRPVLTEMGGFPMLNLNATPMFGINRLVKAIEDRVLAFVLLILTAPLFFLIAAGVKLSSPGPVFFCQKRHGWDGRVIEVWKFRTMVQHEDRRGQVTQATHNDPRVTGFGHWLRRTSLDELPQLLNVLQGSMSIVGPRPHALQHNEFYRDTVDAYMLRHQVKPGITGWAQVNGWRGETDTLEKMRKRIEYDLYYIENWSLLFDIKIIFLTILRGFIHKNAY